MRVYLVFWSLFCVDGGNFIFEIRIHYHLCIFSAVLDFIIFFYFVI